MLHPVYLKCGWTSYCCYPTYRPGKPCWHDFTRRGNNGGFVCVPVHLSALDTLSVPLSVLKECCHASCEYSCSDVCVGRIRVVEGITLLHCGLRHVLLWDRDGERERPTFVGCFTPYIIAYILSPVCFELNAVVCNLIMRRWRKERNKARMQALRWTGSAGQSP